MALNRVGLSTAPIGTPLVRVLLSGDSLANIWLCMLSGPTALRFSFVRERLTSSLVMVELSGFLLIGSMAFSIEVFIVLCDLICWPFL